MVSSVERSHRTAEGAGTHMCGSPVRNTLPVGCPSLGAKRVLGRSVRGGLRRLGYELRRITTEEPMPVDYDEATIALYRAVRPYTMTSHERINALRRAVIYVVEAGVEGAFVECGVWRGGSMLAIAMTLKSLNVTDRDLYLYDTFTMMPLPGDEDVDVLGNRAADLYDETVAVTQLQGLPVEGVRDVMLTSGYPADRLHFVAGMVEDTIPSQTPELLAICRLDTDLYASTKHEMEHLFPRINEGGVLIVDDYGHFMGAKKAIDDYLAAIGGGVLLDRIDFTGRLALVTADIRRRSHEHAASHRAPTLR
jgi:O-methyltransferase